MKMRNNPPPPPTPTVPPPTRLDGGATVPLVAIGGAEDGATPSTSIVLEGVKLGELGRRKSGLA